MKSRIKPALDVLLKSGWSGTYDSASTLLHCCAKTAQRYLDAYLSDGKVYVARYIRQHGQPNKVYALKDAGQQNAEKPVSINHLPYRMRPGVSQRKKLNAMSKQALSGKVRLGVWGL